MTHFSDNQIDAMVAGSPSASARRHLLECGDCRARYESLGARLGSLKTVDAQLELLPEQFWNAQRHAIIAGASAPPVKRFAFGLYTWAGAAAAVVLIAAGLFSTFDAGGPMAGKQSVAISDAQLLESVQQHLDGYPEAFHPAQLMYVEMESHQVRNLPRKRKDTR